MSQRGGRMPGSADGPVWAGSRCAEGGRFSPGL